MENAKKRKSQNPGDSKAAAKPRRRASAHRKAATRAGGAWGDGFRERVRQACLEQKVSNVALARSLGVNPSRISELFSGRILPGAARLRQLAVVLGVSLDWLLLGDGASAVQYRGQLRSAATLESDVAAYVARAVALLLSHRHPDLSPKLDGERLLRLTARYVAREYGVWADRVAAVAQATMPVVDLALHAHILSAVTTRKLSAFAAAELAQRTEECDARAFGAVTDLADTLTQISHHRPTGFISLPTEVDWDTIVSHRSAMAANPWVPPDDPNEENSGLTE